MPSSHFVLIAIDPQNTVNSGAPVVYMVDDNSPADTYFGTGTFTIKAAEGDTIYWNITSIIPSWSAVLTLFQSTGGANVITPYFDQTAGWTGVVNAFGSQTLQFTFNIAGQYTGAGQPTAYVGDLSINVPSPT